MVERRARERSPRQQRCGAPSPQRRPGMRASAHAVARHSAAVAPAQHAMHSMHACSSSACEPLAAPARAAPPCQTARLHPWCGAGRRRARPTRACTPTAAALARPRRRAAARACAPCLQTRGTRSAAARTAALPGAPPACCPLQRPLQQLRRCCRCLRGSCGATGRRLVDEWSDRAADRVAWSLGERAGLPFKLCRGSCGRFERAFCPAESLWKIQESMLAVERIGLEAGSWPLGVACALACPHRRRHRRAPRRRQQHPITHISLPTLLHTDHRLKNTSGRARKQSPRCGSSRARQTNTHCACTFTQPLCYVLSGDEPAV